jgi:hypothetical protein
MCVGAVAVAGFDTDSSNRNLNVGGLTWALPASENLFLNPNAIIPALDRPNVYNLSNVFAGNMSWLAPTACFTGQKRLVNYPQV